MRDDVFLTKPLGPTIILLLRRDRYSAYRTTADGQEAVRAERLHEAPDVSIVEGFFYRRLVMGLQISPDIIRKHFGSHTGHSPEARIKRRILWTIEDADDHGLEGKEVAMDRYGVGTPFGDLLLLIEKNPEHPAWMEAVKRTRRRIPGLLANPRARRAFDSMARTENQNRAALLDELVPAAVLLALTRRSERQRIRLNRSYIKATDGSVPLVAPDSGWLMLEEFDSWLLKEVRNYVEADLLDESYPRQKGDALDRAVPLDVWEAPSSDCEEQDYTGRVAAWMESASPRETEMIRFIDDNPKASDMDVAADLGIARGTVRVMRKRLFEKWKRSGLETPL